MGRKAVWPPRINHHVPSNQDYVRVHTEGKDTNVYLGVHGSPEVQTAYARLIAEMAAHGGKLPPPKPKDGLTVGDVVARFLLWADQEYNQDSREPENFRLSVRPLLRLFDHSPAEQFDTEALRIVQQAMASGSWMSAKEKVAAETRKRPVAWCRNVVNRRMVRLKTLWKWAEEHKLVPPGSYHHLQTLRGLPKSARNVRHTKPRQATAREDLQAVLPHCPKPVAAMLELQWIAGMRSCEVRIMRTVDIDRAGEIWLYRPTKDKNDWREDQAPRVVALGPECQRLLIAWLNPQDPEAYLFPPSRRRSKACYTDQTYAQAVRRACGKAGVKILPYGGRHAAKRRIAKAAGVEAARTVLGHKNIETTSLYGGLDIDLASETMKECG